MKRFIVSVGLTSLLATFAFLCGFYPVLNQSGWGVVTAIVCGAGSVLIPFYSVSLKEKRNE